MTEDVLSTEVVAQQSISTCKATLLRDRLHENVALYILYSYANLYFDIQKIRAPKKKSDKNFWLIEREISEPPSAQSLGCRRGWSLQETTLEGITQVEARGVHDARFTDTHRELSLCHTLR